jgi:hypothetical protein
MDACKQLTGPVSAEPTSETRVPDVREARREYMREYMRKRRAAARRAVAETPRDPDADSEFLTSEFQHLSPTIQSAITIDDINRAELDFAATKLDLGNLTEGMVASLKRFHFGDIRGVENGLLCQARTLDRLFNLFVRRGCREGTADYRELEFRIAFRAQNQYRATLSTLAAIKNPARVAFVNQANITSGPQQVNNSPRAAPDTVSCARDSENRPNELLEAKRGDEWLDTGATAAASPGDSRVETVAALDRAADK